MENGKRLVFFLILEVVFGNKDPKVELPLCPTNIQFLPQTLPMHCRMPRNANFAPYPDGTGNQPTMPPFIPPYYQSPPPDKAPAPFPFPVPPGFPGMPGLQMPGVMPPLPPMPGGMPPMPGPIPMPMNPGAPAHKLPVIVMPFYSPDTTYKKQSTKRATTKRPNSRYLGSFETDGDTSSDDDNASDSDTSSNKSDRDLWKSKYGYRRSGRRPHKHRLRRLKKKHRSDIVTPVLQYVNRNGYVIFEKKISKGEAKEWLRGDQAKQESKKEDREEDDEDIAMNFVQEENKAKDKNRADEKHHVIPPSQPQIKKHRQPKGSKDIKKK